MIIVPDTNIYISAVLGDKGYPGKIERLWENYELSIAISEPIFEELGRVILYERIRKRHQWSFTKIEKYLTRLRKFAIMTPGTTPANVIENDPTDNMFFSCAVEAKADYIISGNIRHVLKITEYEGIRVVSPRDFIEDVMKISKAA